MNCLIRRIYQQYGSTVIKRNICLTPLSQSTNVTSSDEPVDIPNPFQKEKQQCILCKYNIQPDYKNVKLLSQFQSPYTGRLYGRHITGLCSNKQKQVEQEIVKAQVAGFMPYYNKDPDFLHEPKLFDPERPLKPHSYA
ncbi:28S ribosomal protein S18c, mitochondrial-like [Ctenocephalides felis]|uniref:28S ribosomal protein S18c, mitochondrial-like n=1 Tax=Ctenocephalides felis TaxID=7515 RepID=UPI000E6E2D64|nr:28S ribosomal protein S18c, mitochondrial-like [Ctenocephalides felis]XP_026482618.1 28S ribosomal protein S18c, mitochondrial-like [Ctenocephalides felis]